ncbi:diphosphomevalonate decarboxylase [Motiliproteus coralliicola]|uniref:diphosphomevalonate decarboxylase n=1 Tax=Motiliproteus coralliicola TaxID=2283196 RepID=A0A369WTP8_9GAMM|nr:diphosphomevalonate decarboxylase [Motiliproteus coralliicola]RDE24971.1 diphosphomevalonate decarboxylase [Motiliproteus coralliicola]
MSQNPSPRQIVQQQLPKQAQPGPQASAFAPSNIALCKYWGKRDKALNLPINPSLSVSLGQLGSRTELSPIDGAEDRVILNGEVQSLEGGFAAKVVSFLDLFRQPGSPRLQVDTHNNIPTAAGLASSASGFAALMLAVDKLYNFGLSPEQLSAFARLGSGSASRSIFEGFVEWQMGVRDDGMDSHARPLAQSWPNFRIGLLTLTSAAKSVGSRAGMQRTVDTAHLYQSWPLQAAADLERIHQAIEQQDFELLGATAEQNALSMHATMIASWPPLLYWQPESVAAMQQVWALREQGLPLYFTMDAGPNLKLLFQGQDQQAVLKAFPSLQVVAPFEAA